MAMIELTSFGISSMIYISTATQKNIEIIQNYIKNQPNKELRELQK